MRKPLAKIDLSSLDTQNVTDMGWMFYDCRSLTELDLSNFNTKNVKDMYAMFAICNNLATLQAFQLRHTECDKHGRNVLRMQNLTELDLSSFNTKKVTDMFYMFQGCSNLATIYVSDKFVTTRLVSGSDIFKGCENLWAQWPTTAARQAELWQTTTQAASPTSQPLEKPVSYAVLDKETGTLTFRHDKEKDPRSLSDE